MMPMARNPVVVRSSAIVWAPAAKMNLAFANSVGKAQDACNGPGFRSIGTAACLEKIPAIEITRGCANES